MSTRQIKTVKDIRQNLRETIALAECGEATLITRHGSPVAKIVPIDKKRPVFPDMSKFRKSIRVRGKSLSEAVIELRNQERY